MAQGKYSATNFQAWFDNEKALEKFDGDELVVGVDVAKIAFYAAITQNGSDDYDVVYFERDDIREVVEAFAELEFDQVTLVIEPTGTYSDPLVEQARIAGLEVVRINGDRVADARKVFDGTNSLHDAKAAFLLAHLYDCRVGSRWEETSESTRRLRALSDIDELVDQTEDRFRNALEGVLARHWPELPDHLGLTTATLLELLAEFGGPEQVGANPQRARALMKKVSGNSLSDAKLEKIIESARSSQGKMPTSAEREKIRYIAGMLRQSQKRSGELERQIKKVAETHEHTRQLVEFAGARTAVVLVGSLGPLTEYPSTEQLEKSKGMNLCEHSSGCTAKDRRGGSKGLHISKRGPGRVRKMLYWLAMRLINPTAEAHCPYATAWYRERRRRNGDHFSKAIVALMRKLVRALWWVARGKKYDGTKLFDVPRLKKLGHL